MKNERLPLSVLWFGGGQDSTALLYQYAFDADWRAQYTDGTHFIAVMSDTGDEFEDTVKHVAEVQIFCVLNDIEFHYLTPDKGFHSQSWPSLRAQLERNNSIMSAGLPKSCTDALKIQNALPRWGHLTDNELREYKMSHGNCVKSKY